MKLLRFLYLVLTEILFAPIKLGYCIYLIAYNVYIHFEYRFTWKEQFEWAKEGFQWGANANDRFIEYGEYPDLNDL